MHFSEDKGNYQEEQGSGQGQSIFMRTRVIIKRRKGQGKGKGQCKFHEAEIENGLRPPVFFSFEGKGNYSPLPLPAVSVGYLLFFRGQGQWLMYF